MDKDTKITLIVAIGIVCVFALGLNNCNNTNKFRTEACKEAIKAGNLVTADRLCNGIM